MPRPGFLFPTGLVRHGIKIVLSGPSFGAPRAGRSRPPVSLLTDRQSPSNFLPWKGTRTKLKHLIHNERPFYGLELNTCKVKKTIIRPEVPSPRCAMQRAAFSNRWGSGREETRRTRAREHAPLTVPADACTGPIPSRRRDSHPRNQDHGL